MGWSHRHCAEESIVLRKTACSLFLMTLVFATAGPLAAQQKILPVPHTERLGAQVRSLELAQSDGPQVSL